jgi:hypothetical protein
MKLRKCDLVRTRHEKPSNTVIEARWEMDDGAPLTEQYFAVRGGLTFPLGKYPGYLVIGGQNKESGVIRILVDLSFEVLSKLTERLPAFTLNFFLSRIYHDGSDEAQAFYVRIQKSLTEEAKQVNFKIPDFHPNIRAEFPAYGDDLIRELLKNKRLLIPAEIELARQMGFGWAEGQDENQLYAIKALRHLVCGFHDQPYRPPIRHRSSPTVKGPGAWMGH